MNFLGRSKRAGALGAGSRAGLAREQAQKAVPVTDGPLAASLPGTIYALIGTAFTAVTLHGSEPSYVARYAAVCMAVSLGISVAFDLRRGLRNLQRGICSRSWRTIS